MIDLITLGVIKKYITKAVKPGATFTPVVTPIENGHKLAWMNNQKLPNPESINILNGKEGPKGDPGEGFKISKIYPSVVDMNNDYSNPEILIDAFVIVVNEADPADPDNGKVYIKGSTQYDFLLDISNAVEIQGPKGDKGDPGEPGKDGMSKEYIDTADADTLNAANAYTNIEIFHPQHTTMIVTAMQEGIGFKSDYTANEIKEHADGGGVIILRFNAPDGSGEQSYPYETYVNGEAIFRRLFIKNNIVTRISIKIDNKYNVKKEEEDLEVATALDFQLLEDNKADYKLKVLAQDHVTQNDAREVLTFIDQYEGRLIEFLTNGNMPNKCVATGRIMTDATGNSYLITQNRDGTITQWSKETYEKHNFECRSYVNEMVDLDNFTIDVQGDAPYVASVQGAINKPLNTSIYGIVSVIAYAIDKQIQIYTDIETGITYKRIISGTADQHSFSTWRSSLLLASPDGTKYQLTITNNGELQPERI